MRPGDERVLLTVYLDGCDPIETHATAAMQDPGDRPQWITVAGEHCPFGMRPLTARAVLRGEVIDHRAVFAFGHTVTTRTSDAC